MNIVFIGAGNLANHLAKTLYEHSFKILQVYSRTIESAKLLALEVDAEYTNQMENIIHDADIYIFAVKDSILPYLIQNIKSNNGIWVHTAGSMDMNIFHNYSSRFGVLYPFQTFSKTHSLNFKEIPIFLEANNQKTLEILNNISIQISDNVNILSSSKRKYLHLSGIFACNFVNHMYTISDKILKEQDIPFETIIPLIRETASKIKFISPRKAQTGPAIRYDENIINKHLDLIEDTDLKEIYQLLSENIHKENTL